MEAYLTALISQPPRKDKIWQQESSNEPQKRNIAHTTFILKI
jgi:hypothetical protein